MFLLTTLSLAFAAQFNFDLANENHWDGLGMQVFFIDDINGDGIPEFGSGAFCTDYRNDNSGSVYIYDGATQAQLRRHDGFGIQARLGEIAISCPDLNGDGFRDYASGARNERVDGKPKGAVSVWSGLTGDLLYNLAGHENDSDFGRGLACVDDLNGDGVPDLLVGSPNEQNYWGAVRAYSGATGNYFGKIDGPNKNGRFGYSITALGDVNLDGSPDFAVGVPFANTQRGAVYVFSGADGVGLQEFHGTTPYSRLGWSVAGVGDTNGDGKVDMLVGEPCSDKAYLITASTATILREYQGQLLPSKSGVGHCFAAAGDVDGDGFSDYAIGHPGEWDFNSFDFLGGGGGVEVVSGKTGLLIASFEPNQLDDGFGSSIAIYTDPQTGLSGILMGAPAWGGLTSGHAPGMVSGRIIQ